MFKKVFIFSLLFFLFSWGVFAQEKSNTTTQSDLSNSQPNQKVEMYFFWGDGCPHCAAAKPFLEELKKKYPRLEIKAYEVFYNENNKYFWEAMAQSYGTTAEGVPSFFIGDNAWSGYDSSQKNYFYGVIENCLKVGCSSPLVKLTNSHTLSGDKKVDFKKTKESAISGGQNNSSQEGMIFSFLKYIVLGAILFGVLFFVFKE